MSGNKALEEGPKEDNAISAEIAAEDWAAHISELLDEISGKRPAVDETEQSILKTVDLKRIAVMGHSIGGTASILACEKDSRFRACINADGGLDFTRLASSGVHRTALFLRSHPLYSAADLAKRHRTQEEFDKMGKKALTETQALFSKPGGEAWVLSIDGTGHMSYSDAPYTMPTTISRFGGTIIEPGRLFKIVIRLMETYMEHEFDPSKLFQPNEFPELKLAGFQKVRKVVLRSLVSAGNRTSMKKRSLGVCAFRNSGSAVNGRNTWRSCPRTLSIFPVDRPGKMADTGHTGTHAPQSMHSTGSMNSMLEPSNCGSSFLG